MSYAGLVALLFLHGTVASPLPPGEVPSGSVSPDDLPPEDASSWDVPRWDVPAWEVPPREALPWEVPPWDVPPGEVPAGDVSPAEVLPEEVPPFAVPSPEAPLGEVPLAEMPPPAAPPAESLAPEVPSSVRAGALRVFIDCAACDQDFLRSEITFVDYVRDREDADVHVLVATEGTGAGGTEYSARFIGLRRFEGVDQVLRYVASQTDTVASRRRGITQVLELGLVRYAAETPLAANLTVALDVPRQRAPGATTDRWDFWVFRTRLAGQISGERATALRSLNGSVGANRTTEAWKLDFGLDGDYSRQRFDIGDGGETFTTTSHSASARALMARSLADHWAVGLTASASRSTFLNYKLRTRVGPGIEYNVYPYSESTRRILTILYGVGLQTLAYREETLFGRRFERRPDHRLQTTLALLQPWGSASLSAGGAQFLTLRDMYRLSSILTLEIRLSRGLAMDVSARVAYRRDQINLPRGTATDQEILLRQRELATDYEYDVSVGFSYTFGSIFNNVVNPRFRDAAGL